jgi:hypothetical protein
VIARAGIIAAEAGAGGNSVLAGVMMAAGVLIITVVMMMRLWRARRRNTARAATPIADRAGLTPRAAAREGTERMEAVMVEMQELTRVCAAQVENRVARLEMLLREADDRIARLSAATGETPQVSARNPSQGSVGGAAARPAPVVRPIIGADELSQRVYALADTGMAPGDVARELGEHTGKVELILALRQESRRAGAGAGAGA